MTKTQPLISVNELMLIAGDPEVLIFDVSNGANARASYEREHLRNAVFVDLNTQLAEIKADPANGGRHPLPDPENFASTLAQFGITTENHVVIYDDRNGSNAAARFWWMLKAAGHNNVQVLNGGKNEAKRHNFPMEAGSRLSEETGEVYPFENWIMPIADITEVASFSSDSDCLIIDVRDRDRYLGLVEPIDLVAGHIPGAVNMPFTENLDADGLFANADILKAKYEAAFGGRTSNNIIVHCGSGVTACHTLLALAHAGLDIPKLYVGSWSEWSRRNDRNT